ncbi:MAG: NAD-dependent deacylase, partial [Verrucomicrobiaceae bacterium]
AGISAESGLPTFRDANGLWEGHRVEEVATPQAFEHDPETVLRFYNLRRAALATVQPNAAHLAIARLQRDYPGQVTLITQNVDDLHERGGSADVIHMHGTLLNSLCSHCRATSPWPGDMRTSDVCTTCGETGTLRPDIVWFGEMPYHMEAIETALASVDLFVAIGTSGHVHPAAGFVAMARYAGAGTLEINNAGTAVSGSFADHRTGPASVEVPVWVDRMLAGQ